MTEPRLTQPSPAAVPKNIISRIRDTDTHEMTPARLWTKEFGEFARPLADHFIAHMSEEVPNSYSVRRVEDVEPIEEKGLPDYWSKGCLAPSAFDIERRLEFMNVAGIDDCLIYGTLMSSFGQQLLTVGASTIERMLGGEFTGDTNTLGRTMLRAHNDWCIRTAKISPRLRPVPVVLTESLRDAISETEHLISEGIRAVTMPVGRPVGGKAPAHPDNDALWRLCSDNNLVVLFHIGGERGFVRDLASWSDAPQFAGTGSNNLPSELPVDPFTLASSNLAIQYFLSNMILGAVFERVPNLRVGVAEYGSHWVGPLAENLDQWVEYFARRLSGVFSIKPSEYVRRNVRVTPFHFEPIDLYIERHEFLADVYCFGSDYPHKEGGKEPREEMMRRLQRLGSDVVEKFFVKNADWIMPR